MAEKKKKDAIRLRWFLGTFALRGFRIINVTSQGTLPASRFACRSIPPAVSIFRTKQYVWYVVAFKWLIISLLRRSWFPTSQISSAPAHKHKRPAGLLGVWSGKRESNSRPRPCQGRGLPTERFPQYFKDSFSWNGTAKIRQKPKSHHQPVLLRDKMPDVGQLLFNQVEGNVPGIAAPPGGEGRRDARGLPHAHARSLDAEGGIGAVVTGNGAAGDQHMADALGSG